MKAYYSVWRLRMQLGMQYRSAALAGIATQFFFGFLHTMIFVAFYANAAVEPPMSISALATYIWLKQAFLAFVMLWVRDNELFGMITSGNIAYELCRPTRIYGFWYAKLTAQRISSALLRCFPILLVAFFLPEPYRMGLPASFATFVVFVAALLLGLFVLVSISMLIYISVFYTLSPNGSLTIVVLVADFFSGMLVPLPLMPDWVQTIAYALPFHLTVDFPFRVYSGHIPLADVWGGLGLQLIWLVALVAFGSLALRHAMRRVVVQGG